MQPHSSCTVKQAPGGQQHKPVSSLSEEQPARRTALASTSQPDLHRQQQSRAESTSTFGHGRRSASGCSTDGGGVNGGRVNQTDDPGPPPTSHLPPPSSVLIYGLVPVFEIFENRRLNKISSGRRDRCVQSGDRLSPWNRVCRLDTDAVSSMFQFMK